MKLPDIASRVLRVVVVTHICDKDVVTPGAEIPDEIRSDGPETPGDEYVRA